ncbi:MinD/ParA family ATP-binding protein [Mycolicibacterium hodleri]|uniref:MinD/ParA family protein n=1 Tax=Mycolicibacterium hodleri TaxID=49897 RepID=A0A502EC29_9MYCO|nr:MinD/ParA family protein [Mycolicibacterium hodleri]TPG35295.1 MinD/ParA family protein [Mycolicibacterium hodleri]
MNDRDDALRKELGRTGPEETDYEPAVEPPFKAATTPLPSRPPVDYPTREAAAEVETPREHLPPEAPPPPPPPPPRDVERPDGGPRPPQRFGPPPGTPRDTGALPVAGRQADPPPQWRPPAPPPPHQQQPGWQGQPPRPNQPPPGQGPPQYGPWQGQPHGQDSRAAPPPPTGSYADRIRADDLVPSKRIVPARGWRRVVYKATFGLINPGQSPEEIREAQLEARIKVKLRGHYKVGVMGKGGVGKTTVSASIGSVFAELRQEDRVVAIDADTAFGKLGSRVDPKAVGSYWELAGDQHLETFADVRSRVGNNSAGLFVLAGEGSPARRRVLDPAIYREATARLDRYFSIAVVDCSSTMDTPVTQEVLRDLDALVVVSSPWVDGAAAAGQTMDWLANRGLTSLLRRTVVVLNDSDGHADKRTRAILAQQFAGQGQVVIEVPFDPHLRPGGVIEGTAEMSGPTRRKFLEIAAALAEHFPANGERGRDR